MDGIWFGVVGLDRDEEALARDAYVFPDEEDDEEDGDEVEDDVC